MKKILLLLFLFAFSLHVIAVDWDLFQLNQKSYYKYYNPYPVADRIDLVLLDSIVTSGSTTTSFFLRKYYGSAHGTCYSQMLTSYYPFWGYVNPEMDSLYQLNDTIFNGLVFKRDAVSGQTWNTHGSLSSGFTDLHTTCISNQPETFLGITDSVKTFSFSSYNGNTHFASTFDTIQFKLSKRYGLIQYVPFKYMIWHSITQLYYHSLAGIFNGTLSAGFTAPSYLRFFPYHPGDILNWQFMAACSTCIPPTIIYYRDSITQVNFSPDTISYTYNHWALQQSGSIQYDSNRIQKYSVIDLINVFEAPTNWFAISGEIGSTNGNYSQLPIYTSDYYTIDVSGTDTTIGYSYSWDGDELDTTICYDNQIPDASTSMSMNTKQGITHYCSDAFHNFCTTLIGSIILGDTIGYTELPVGINEISSAESFVIYPNPTASTFTLKSLSFENPTGRTKETTSLQIINPLGEIVYQCTIHNAQYTIDASDFPKGIYFVEVSSEQKKIMRKLIVE